MKQWKNSILGVIKAIFLFLILFLFSACSHNSAGSLRYQASPPEFTAVDKIVNYTHQQMQREGFELISTGGAFAPTIRLVTDGYISKKYAYTSIDEMQVLICKIYDMYLKSINKEKSIRPYLFNYPFTINNIDLSFTFLDKKGKLLVQPYITFVRAIKGQLIFETVDKNRKTTLVYQENFGKVFRSYEERKSL